MTEIAPVRSNYRFVCTQGRMQVLKIGLDIRRFQPACNNAAHMVFAVQWTVSLASG